MKVLAGVFWTVLMLAGMLVAGAFVGVAFFVPLPEGFDLDLEEASLAYGKAA